MLKDGIVLGMEMIAQMKNEQASSIHRRDIPV